MDDEKIVPENANTGCVGPSSDMAGKVDGCSGCPNQSICASGASKVKSNADEELVQDRLAAVKHKILVLSGKGGVGRYLVPIVLLDLPYFMTFRKKYFFSPISICFSSSRVSSWLTRCRHMRAIYSENGCFAFEEDLNLFSWNFTLHS